jgi:hypothetical protein
MGDKKYQCKAHEEMAHIGHISTKLFSKLQTMMNDCNEHARYECLYNLLVLWKEQDAKSATDQTTTP